MFVTKIQSNKDKIFKACPNLEFFLEFWVFWSLTFFSKCRKKEAALNTKSDTPQFVKVGSPTYQLTKMYNTSAERCVPGVGFMLFDALLCLGFLAKHGVPGITAWFLFTCTCGLAKENRLYGSCFNFFVHTLCLLSQKVSLLLNIFAWKRYVHFVMFLLLR